MRLFSPLALLFILSTTTLSFAVAQETVAEAAEVVDDTAQESSSATVDAAASATANDATEPEANAVKEEEQKDEEEVISLDDEEESPASEEPTKTDDAAEAAAPSDASAAAATAAAAAAAAPTEPEKEEEPAEKVEEKVKEEAAPVQTGPFIDIFGEQLLSLQMVDETHAQLVAHYTNEALSGKKVVGLYFSADWCGPCRQFTPDLVNFYNKMNSRRGKENDFEIVWISRCRDMDSYGQYFTQMNWLALPPQEAMGQRGQMLSNKYKVKGIPTLVLLDEVGNVITTDGRNKIPMDKAGIGFPWRNPLATLYITVIPKSLRLMIKSQIEGVKSQILGVLRGATGQATA